MHRPQADDLAEIKARIRALRAKTVERGCTEEEALAAAAKAAELMQRHALSAELVDRPPIVQSVIPTPWARTQAPWSTLWSAIATCTHVKAWRNRADGMTYFGFEPDVLVAEYLHELLGRYVEMARREFVRTPEYTRKRLRKSSEAAVTSFLTGYIEWVSRKLLTLFDAHSPAADSERKAKREVLDADIERRRIELTDAKVEPRMAVNENAYWAGRRAAADVVINRGVGGSAQALVGGRR